MKLTSVHDIRQMIDIAFDIIFVISMVLTLQRMDVIRLMTLKKAIWMLPNRFLIPLGQVILASRCCRSLDGRVMDWGRKSKVITNSAMTVYGMSSFNLQLSTYSMSDFSQLQESLFLSRWHQQTLHWVLERQ